MQQKNDHWDKGGLLLQTLIYKEGELNKIWTQNLVQHVC